MCLFVCLHANDAASVDHDDALSWVQPVAPSLEKTEQSSAMPPLHCFEYPRIHKSAGPMLQDVSGKFCRKHASCLQWNILQSAPPWSNSFPHTGPQQIFFEVQSWAPDLLRRFPLALVLVLLTSHLAGHHSTRVFTLQAVGSIPTQLPWILP